MSELGAGTLHVPLVHAEDLRDPGGLDEAVRADAAFARVHAAEQVAEHRGDHDRTWPARDVLDHSSWNRHAPLHVHHKLGHAAQFVVFVKPRNRLAVADRDRGFRPAHETNSVKSVQ